MAGKQTEPLKPPTCGTVVVLQRNGLKASSTREASGIEVERLQVLLGRASCSNHGPRSDRDRRIAESSLIDHDDRVIPERTPRITDKQLDWAARKAAGSALKPDDVLLDVAVGNLRRFRDNGMDRPVVTPKKWARAIPAARGIMTVTYTLEQVLFLSDGRAVNCALIRIHRAQPLADHHQLFAFAGRSS